MYSYHGIRMKCRREKAAQEEMSSSQKDGLQIPGTCPESKIGDYGMNNALGKIREAFSRASKANFCAQLCSKARGCVTVTGGKTLRGKQLRGTSNKVMLERKKQRGEGNAHRRTDQFKTVVPDKRWAKIRNTKDGTDRIQEREENVQFALGLREEYHTI